ncbi:MAG: O-antigen ligase family protein [Bacillota bacterium]
MRQNSSLRTTGLNLILLVLLVAPFYQGLFFPTPMLTAITALTLGFGLWLYGRRADRLPLGLPGDWAGASLLALTLIYVLQFGWAAYARGNLDWVLRCAAAWFAFVMISQENGPKLRSRLGWTMLIAGALVAFLGVLEYGQFFEQQQSLRELLNIKRFTGRLLSLFQYPNAAGAFLLATWMVGVGLMLEEAGNRKRLLLAGLNSLISVALFLTLSRGVVVVLPVALILMVAGLARTEWFRALLFMGATLAVPVAAAFKPLPAASSAANWGLALLGALLAAGLGVLATWGATRVSSLPARTIRIGLAGLVALGLAGGALWVGSRPLGEAVPQQLERLMDINLETQNVQTRIDFTQTALRMFADQPLGRGGFGWERGYRLYQQANYASRETHNHYVQVLVDAGALGLLALAAGVVLALWTGFRHRKDQPARWMMVAAGGMLAAHAVIDFDLSYFSLWLLMWLLLAVGQEPTPLTAKQERRFLFPAALGVTLLVGLLAAVLTVAGYAFTQAQKAVQRQDYEVALRQAKLAIQLDPLNSDYLRFLRLEENLLRATRVDPHSPFVWEDLAQFREKQRDLPGALEAAQKAAAVHPMHIDRYTTAARLGSALLDEAVTQDKREVALSTARELTGLSRQLEERMAVAAAKQHLYPYPKLEWKPVLHLAVGKAQLLLGELAEAEKHLLAALKDSGTAGEAALWLDALYTRKGDEAARANMPVQLEGAVRLSPLYRALSHWQ